MQRQTYRTPGTRLWWSNVAEWCACAHQFHRRRLSRKRHRDLETHGMCMPLATVAIEDDTEAIAAAIWLPNRGPTGLPRPKRGKRGDHPTTPLIMALMNRAAVLRRAAEKLPRGDNWTAVFGSDNDKMR